MLITRTIAGMGFKEAGVGKLAVMVDDIESLVKEAELCEGEGKVGEKKHDQSNRGETGLADGVGEIVVERGGGR